MLAFDRAKPEEYGVFLQLMRDTSAEFLDHALQVLGVTWAEFEDLFRSVGLVYSVYDDGALAGFYWIEERRDVLHLHGIVLKPEFRGRKIGTQVLEKLEREHRQKLRVIELGVHESNEGARRLYERLGFKVVRTREDVGFLILQKPFVG